MSALHKLLHQFRRAAQSQREKGTYEWVMERQSVTTHKDSGIVNDANDWAIETMNNARYPLELLQRVITVSVETMKIVNALPKLEV